MSARRRAAWAGVVIGLPLSGLFLWLAAMRTDLTTVWRTLSGARVGDVVAAMAFMISVYVVQALRWRGIARGREPRRRYVWLVVGGVAANNVLPGRVGDGLRGVWLARAEGIPSGRSLATVVFDRAADVIALVGLLAIALPFSVRPAWLVKIAIGGLALAVLIGGMLVAARAVSRVHQRAERARSRLRRVARDLLDGLAQPPGIRRAGWALLLSVTAWSMWSVGAWLVAHSIGIHLSALDALLVAGVVNLGVAIPSSPGFVGTYQWLCVSTLGLVGVGRSPALAFSILLHASWYVPTTLVGGAMLVWRLLPARRRPLARASSVMASATRALTRQTAPHE